MVIFKISFNILLCRNDKSTKIFLILPYDNRSLYILALLESCLNRNRLNILTSRKNNRIFCPTNY